MFQLIPPQPYHPQLGDVVRIVPVFERANMKVRVLNRYRLTVVDHTEDTVTVAYRIPMLTRKSVVAEHTVPLNYVRCIPKKEPK